MKTQLLICIAIGFCSTSTAFGQSDAKEIAIKYKRLTRTITTAFAESRRKSELELVDSQKGEIEELYGDYRAATKMIKGIPKDQRNERMPELLKKLESVQDNILNDVLLPNQADMLQSKIFANNVKSYQGNFIRAIVDHYGDELDLDDQAVARLKEIESDAAKRMTQAREKYLTELKKITESVRQDLGGTLPPEHLKLIDGLSFDGKQQGGKDAKGLLKNKAEKRLKKENKKKLGDA